MKIDLPVGKLEKDLTLSIAHQLRRPWLDRFMTALSDPYRWIIILLVLVLLLFYQNWRSGLAALSIGGLGAAITDWINTRFLKPYSSRERPCKVYPEVNQLGSMNHGRRSFPSNHAANTMAIALAIGLFFPGIQWLLLLLVVLVGYSRIYCGAHYPLDVAAGWLHGGFWTFILFTCFIILLKTI